TGGSGSARRESYVYALTSAGRSSLPCKRRGDNGRGAGYRLPTVKYARDESRKFESYRMAFEKDFNAFMDSMMEKLPGLEEDRKLQLRAILVALLHACGHVGEDLKLPLPYFTALCVEEAMQAHLCELKARAAEHLPVPTAWSRTETPKA
ncbi:MAG: hypothetical protein ACTS5I_13775, partial [Rhodanobacter sp.]